MCLPNCQPVVIIQSFPGVHGSVIAEGIIGGVVCVASEPSCSPSLVFFFTGLSTSSMSTTSGRS